MGASDSFIFSGFLCAFNWKAKEMGVNCLDIATCALQKTGYHSVRPAWQRPGFVKRDNSSLAVLFYRVLDYVAYLELSAH